MDQPVKIYKKWISQLKFKLHNCIIVIYDLYIPYFGKMGFKQSHKTQSQMIILK